MIIEKKNISSITFTSLNSYNTEQQCVVVDYIDLISLYFL